MSFNFLKQSLKNIIVNKSYDVAKFAIFSAQLAAPPHCRGGGVGWVNEVLPAYIDVPEGP